MSGGYEVLALKEDDVQKFLAAQVHIGDPNVDYQMAQYVYKVRQDGIPIINLKKTWEKLLLAARVIAAVENPADICVLSNRPMAQRAVLKFSGHTGSTSVAGRFTPGTFTNQIQKAFREPRILVVSDPKLDHQPVTEASYVNIPVIAFCNTNSPLKNVDIAIPCNSNGKHAVGLMWWMLAREVLRLRGTISRDLLWDVMPDLYFFREPEEIEKEEQEKAEDIAQADTWGGQQVEPLQQTQPQADQWPDTTQTTDWGKETTTKPAGTTGISQVDQEWNVATSTTKDWGAEDTAGDWTENTGSAW